MNGLDELNFPPPAAFRMKLAAEAPPLAAPPVSADVVSGLQSKPAPMHPRLRTVTDEKPKR